MMYYNNKYTYFNIYMTYDTFSHPMQETLEDIDKNGDGFIDLKEYIGMYRNTHIITSVVAFKIILV